jgi:hypothetical protein
LTNCQRGAVDVGVEATGEAAVGGEQDQMPTRLWPAAMGQQRVEGAALPFAAPVIRARTTSSRRSP